MIKGSCHYESFRTLESAAFALTARVACAARGWTSQAVGWLDYRTDANAWPEGEAPRS